MGYFSKVFWQDASERAIKTAAQAVLLALGFGIGTGVVDGTEMTQSVNAFLLDWRTLIGFALGGALVSYLFSIATAQFTKGNSASVVVDNVKPKK